LDLRGGNFIHSFANLCNVFKKWIISVTNNKVGDVEYISVVLVEKSIELESLANLD
jgi:hypothetical protein